MYFSSEIKKLREKHNWTIEEAADLLNFSPKELAELENNEREPHIEELKALSVLYKKSIDQLLDMKEKRKRRRRKHIIYNIKRRKLVGFNRYGMKQGVSVITVPIMAFIALCLMFVPGFAVSGQTVSLMKLMFLTARPLYTVLGCFMLVIFGFIIIYWAVELMLGNYYRAKMKSLNNIILSAFSVFTFVVTLLAVLTFHSNILAGGIITYIALFLVTLTQVIFLIVMNLEGGEGSSEQVYIYHECDYSGYENKHWFTLGLSALSLVSFVLMFITAYHGQVNILQKIDATMFQIFFNSSNVIGLFIGGLAFAILILNIGYWILICTLPRLSRRKTNNANNLILVISNILLFIDTIAIMSYFGLEFITDGGIALLSMLILTSTYGLCIIPIINCSKKSMYVEDENGLHKVARVQGEQPGKIMAYKFSAIPQYVMLVLLAVLTGIAFLSPKINFVAFFAVPAFILEIIFLCFQRNGKYVNISIFAYGIIVNTIIAFFSTFLLVYSIFGKVTGASAIVLPIVSAIVLLVYACIIFFLKPIRGAASKLE